MTSNRGTTIVAISMVFIGCCTNVVFLELLMKEVPSCGNIVTFVQFLLIALLCFLSNGKSLLKPVIPLSYYILMVIMFFVVQVVNNLSLGFNVSMPLHMIFRSGSLMANLLLGVVILKKGYTLSKYLSVIVITVGIAICTVASVSDVRKQPAEVTKIDDQTDQEQTQFIRWCTGISMLIFALFMSARMGIFQEETYRKFGKQPNEALFYNHFLPLPGFLLLASDIVSHVTIFNQSESSWLLPLVPRLWLWLAGNAITQYVCIRGVFILTTECSSLTVSLVVTLRKFVSLLFSIFYFQNPFTLSHWIGAVLVFGGTLVFTETHIMAAKVWTSLSPRRNLPRREQRAD